jgi:hypothetical protein
LRPATGAKSRKIPAVAIAVVVIVASVTAVLVYTNQGILGNPGGRNLTASSYSMSSSDSASGGAIFIQVVNESGMTPIAGMSVIAGPAPSPNDVEVTLDLSYTLSECVHEVPSGAVVDNETVVVNGTTTTLPACPLKEYTTDSSGWISITDPSGPFYLIEAGSIPLGWNDIVVGVEVNNVVNMTIPVPSGNVTVPSGGPGATQSRLPVLWPQTTTVWPCAAGLPSGSAVVSQGVYAGEYIAYSYAALTNGTKAALIEDAACSNRLAQI